MYLTTENAAWLAGKQIDAEYRAWHYYPLTVGQWPDGTYFFKDRNGVAMAVPAPDDRFTRVWFDQVLD